MSVIDAISLNAGRQCRVSNFRCDYYCISQFGGLGATLYKGAAAEQKTAKSIDIEEGAQILSLANRVIIIPGYGMAAAQAQHSVRELEEELEKKGVEVEFAVHPVAGKQDVHVTGHSAYLKEKSQAYLKIHLAIAARAPL